MERVLAVILGGGQGTRLYPLTKYRSKPAVPFGGKYRLVDIPISNCLNSGLKKIYILTQFNSASLNRHIYQTYKLDSFSQGFIEILAAEQTLEHMDWYQGTADAVRKQMHRFIEADVDQILVLAGDHLYQMNYRDFVHRHRTSGAEVTVAVNPVDRAAAGAFGILEVNGDGRIVEFMEKPQDDALLRDLKADFSVFGVAPEAYPGKDVLASMGIYVFEKHMLAHVLDEVSENDFGKSIIPHCIRTHRVYAHFFDGYWEDIGTIKAFYEANLGLTDPIPRFNLYRAEAPVYTHGRFLPSSKILDCVVRDAVLSEGCVIQRARIERSIIGVRSIVGEDARISNAVVMGADFYEEALHTPAIGIGRRSIVERAIVDKNARIGDDVIIRGKVDMPDREEENYVVRDGVVVVLKNAVIPSGTRI